MASDLVRKIRTHEIRASDLACRIRTHEFGASDLVCRIRRPESWRLIFLAGFAHKKSECHNLLELIVSMTSL